MLLTTHFWQYKEVCQPQEPRLLAHASCMLKKKIKRKILFFPKCQVICFELLDQGGLNSSISVKVLNGLGKEKETLQLSALYRAV